ncbi:hypothetical protein GIB67_011692 [Kingdonia uniflora]|uniref:C2 domain-containing protein n=1 Tax=Kingdonia uniflora TaxID=39325 RepID=A0A7J7LUL5_9MAGN|nr:hypothetical protein GIB67_011692 [Kingdonia uniflora]
MIRYRSTRRNAKAVDLKLLECLNKDNLKKICGDNYPAWISFLVFEQVKWLKNLLSKMWPFIAELKPQGKVSVTAVRGNNLKNMEMLGKCDPYVVLSIRLIFKVKTKVINGNLNPIWDQTFELIAEDKETQAIIFEVFDQDVGQDKLLGVAKLPLIKLIPGTPKEINLRLLPSLDMIKIKNKKDRGTLTLKVLYHQFSKEEQLAALEVAKMIQEERKKMKEARMNGSTINALDGAASLVGFGVGLVDTGIGAGVGIICSGFGAVGSGLSKAGKFMGRSITGQSVRLFKEE